MNKLITIVIPVYKVEKYIRKCLDSLLIYETNEHGEQVLNDELMSLMDILIINDGTPDKSAEISREYVKQYPQYYHQIDKENGGHGSAWNMGVELALGKYIRFLDSDDWLMNVDIFLKKLQQTNSDLILTMTRCICEHNEIWTQQIVDMEFYHPYDTDTFDWLGNRTHNYLLHHCCTYKTEVFRQFMPNLFLEKQPYDDVVLWPAAMIGAKTIEAFDFPLYNYLMDRPGQSISAEVQRRNQNAKLKTDQYTIEFYEKHPVLPTSTKAKYIANKLPKAYGGRYREYVKLPYHVGKKLLRDWDCWAKKTNPNRTNIQIKMYRALPYFVYFPLCRLGQIGLSLLHKQTDNIERYVHENP